MLLKDKIILITGAGGGLGSTAALTLAQQGACIVLLDKIIPKLEKIYDAIVASGAPEPVMYPFDLAGANETEYEELALAIANQYGALHGLLHSALQFNYFTPLSSLKTHEWGDTLNVNLSAAFLLTRVLLPVMQQANHASIVFTSDSSARQAKAYSAAYGISKIALEGLAQIWASELEAGGKIRVNTLIPGAVDSPFRKKAYPGEDKTILPPMTCLNPVYHYLFSDESIGITGQTIHAQTFNLP
jgi:NAD(P)-dependent dehydrogenase (short-subunit alcohol dehydrogenase family)